MDSDVEKLLKNSIDIDLLKDAQSPIYQTIDIHRQRLLSVLDRALEKIAIAYALEEMLTENISILSHYMTEAEINSLLKMFNLARRENDHSAMTSSTKKIATLKSYLSVRSLDSDSFYKNPMPSKASLTSSVFQIDKNLDEKEYTVRSHRTKKYYTHILATLQFIPEVPNLAKSMISKRPITDIKYYIYLRDLRNFVCKMIYTTKTEELNYKKTIKKAFVRNLKEKPQAKAIKKILQEKLNERNEIAEQLKSDIENERVIQAEMNLKLLCDATDIIVESERKNVTRAHESHIFQEEKKRVYADRLACYNKLLHENIKSIDKLRKKIRKIEVIYKNILDNYDGIIGELHERYEVIYEKYSEVKLKLDVLTIDFDIQDEEYTVLMAEREHLIEMTCLRIRYNRAAKLVQRWWRKILLKRWKWRKTYVELQLKRRSLSRSQKKRMKKIIKKIREKQRRQKKRFFN